MSGSKLKPVIFLAFANDRGERIGYLRHLAEEARALEQILEKAEKDDLCEIVLRYNVTTDDLVRVFQNPNYRGRIAIFHYAGHANSYQLLLETPQGESLPAEAQDLANFLGLQHGLQLVFLNGCSTEPQAQGLLAVGVPVVIATAQLIADNVAVQFAQGFYGSLAGGTYLEAAYQEAVAAVGLTMGGSSRGLAPADGELPHQEQLAWHLLNREGAEQALRWSLADAVGKPLFSLPSLPALDLPESPYRHLHYYQREHASVFFGRGYEIRDLYHRIQNRQSPPILLVYGQSGVGKSSLLAAGLLPRLESHYCVHYRRWERGVACWTALLTSLGCEDAAGAAEVWRKAETEAGRPVVVVLDQLEAIFTQPDPNHPDDWPQFLDGLKALFDHPDRRPHGKLLLSFRKEWLLEIESGLSKHALPRHKVPIEPLDARGILEVIEGPAVTPSLQQNYGLSLEPGLAQSIVEDVSADRESPVAPVLQMLLSKLWEQARAKDYAHPYFSRSEYQNLKRYGLLLGDFLDQELSEIERVMPEGVHKGLLHDILAFFTTPQGTAEERSRQELDEHYGQNASFEQLLALCQAHYLIVDSSQKQATEPPNLRLCHDALAPLVQVRYDDSDRPGQRARRILENRVSNDPILAQSHFLDETDLAAVETGADGMRRWTPNETHLVEASRHNRDQRQRRRKQYKAMTVSAFILLLITTTFASWQWQVANDMSSRAQVKQKEAENERLLAQSRQLAAQANLALTATPTDWILGTLLATEALKHKQTTEAYQAWARAMKLLPRNTKKIALNNHERISDIAFNPDGTELAIAIAEGGSGVGKGDATIWDTQTWNTKFNIAHQGTIKAMAFSPDSKLIATASWDRSIQIQDVDTGQVLHRRQFDQPLASLAFNHDGQKLAVGGLRGGLWLYNVGNDKVQLQIHTAGSFEQLEFSPDGYWLAAGNRDGSVHLYEASTGERQHQLTHTAKVNRLRWSPNGTYLAAASSESPLVSVWETKQWQQVYQFKHGGDIGGISFSDDNILAVASYDASSYLWQMDTGQQKAHFMCGDEVWDIAFTPDGNNIITLLSKAGKSQLWFVNQDSKPVREFVHNGFVNSMAINPNGKILVTGGEDSQVKVWNLENGELQTKMSLQDKINQVLLSPDGKQFAASIKVSPNYDSGNSWGEVRILNPQTGEIKKSRGAGPRWLSKIAYTPDGNSIVTAAGDGIASLWDLKNDSELLKMPHATSISDFVIQSQGHKLLSLNTKGYRNYQATGNLWNLTTGERISSLDVGEPGGARHLKLSDDGLFAMTKKDDVQKFWDLQTGQEIKSSENIVEIPSRRQQRFAGKGQDHKTIEIWDINNQKVALLDHDSDVFSYRLSPNGKWLVACLKSDPNLWLWQVDSQSLTKLAAPTEFMACVPRFSPDSRYLAMSYFGSRDSTNPISLWNLDDLSSSRTLVHSCQHLVQPKIVGFNVNTSQLFTSAACGTKLFHSSLYTWNLQNGIRKSNIPLGEVRHDLALSANGLYLGVVNISTRSLQIWNLATQTLLKEIKYDITGNGINDLALSKEGKYLAISHFYQDKTTIWDLSKRSANMKQIPVGGRIVSLKFLAQENRLLTRDFSDSVRIFDVDSGNELFNLKHSSTINHHALGRNKPVMATASGNRASIWNIRADNEILKLPFDREVSNIVLNNKGDRLISIIPDDRYHDSNILQVWNIESGKELFQLVHDGEISFIAFNPNDTRILTGSTDYTARIWDAETGRQLAQFQHEQSVVKVQMTEDGRYLITQTKSSNQPSEEIHIWDITTKTQLARLPHYEENINQFLYDQHHRTLVTTSSKSRDSTLRLWDLNNIGSELTTIPLKPSPSDSVISNDGRFFGLFRQSDTSESWIGIYDLNQKKQVYKINGENIYQLILSPDNATFATRAHDAFIRVYDTHSYQLKGQYEHQKNLPHLVTYSPDGQTLASFDSGNYKRGSVKLWDIKTNTSSTLIYDSIVNHLAFGPDGKRLASSEGGFNLDDWAKNHEVVIEGTSGIRIWDVTSGEEKLRIALPKPPSKVLFSPDGQYLFSETHNYRNEPIRVWEAQTGSFITNCIEEGESENVSLDLGTFSPDGQYLTAKSGHSLYLLGMDSLSVKRKFKFQNLIDSVIFSPNSQAIAVVHGEEVSVLSLNEGQEIAHMHSTGAEILSTLTFTPDSRHIILVGSKDRKIRIWAWQKTDIINDACRRLERNLTLEEWQTYVGYDDYEPTCNNLPGAETRTSNHKEVNRVVEFRSIYGDDENSFKKLWLGIPSSNQH